MLNLLGLICHPKGEPSLFSCFDGAKPCLWAHVRNFKILTQPLTFPSHGALTVQIIFLYQPKTPMANFSVRTKPVICSKVLFQSLCQRSQLGLGFKIKKQNTAAFKKYCILGGEEGKGLEGGSEGFWFWFTEAKLTFGFDWSHGLKKQGN